MSLVAGTRLGPYEIQSTIGASGMGEVYKAGTQLKRDVALKTLAPSRRIPWRDVTSSARQVAG